MGIRPTLLQLPRNATLSNGMRMRYPPTYFVYMARDVAMADWIALDADKLKSQVGSQSPWCNICTACKSICCWSDLHDLWSSYTASKLGPLVSLE
jgi:hypothetical protein